ncbi:MULTISPECIES: long-chain-fatty-acid--CoA ligase [Protofrankia]|uniref:long-chain-fatty-acid--CoA ligase n=1 Tax=Protofrankia TaxID=2994361 RepID=UPI00069B2279|nr:MULTISPECIES: long-chain-fatty-acid--CoA ligase [Protofrankia]ONH35109.1 hypothetical protein BL254_13005 [Protofrankia sp. BMG5.30]
MTLTIADLVRRHAGERPTAPAVTCGASTLTFAELDRRSSQVARALLRDAAGHGDRVAMIDKNSPAFFEALLGCSKIGAVLVGVNWRLAPREVADILRDAEVSLVLAGPEFVGLLPAGQAAVKVVVLDDRYEQWLQGPDSTDPRHDVSPHDVVLQLYSSGTTGLPKGARITSANLLPTADMAKTAWRMSERSVNLVTSPLFHIGGAGYSLTTLSQGGHTVIARQADAAGLLAEVERHGVTHAFWVPAVLASVLDAPEATGADLSSLELIGYGGAPMSGFLMLRAMERLSCGFLGVYGMTETSGTVLYLPPEAHDPAGPRAGLMRSVGRPLPWVEIEIRDPATTAPLPANAVGEIWIRCAQNMVGYWNQPETTAATLVDGGWLRTGDAAHRDEEGYVFLHDRLKDMIITGGENVYPAEVESVLADHPAVADVAVIAVPSQRWGETVKAVVVLRPGATATEEEVIAFTRTRLARYKCPTSMDVVTELPRNASGKVLKKDLREPYWSVTGAGGPATVAGPAGPAGPGRTAAAAALVRRWSVDWLNGRHPEVCEEILSPDYTLLIGGYLLGPRDEYVPATLAQLNRYPGLVVTAHQVIAAGDRVAVWFTEHGASARLEGRRAAWPGVALFRSNGEQLTHCFCEEDYYARRRQLDRSASDVVDAPAVAPWDPVPGTANPAAESVVKAWLGERDLRSAPVVIDDAVTGAQPPEQVLDVTGFTVNEMFSAGPQVAFHATQTGVYAGGLDGLEGALGDPALLHLAGIVEVRDARIVGGRVVRDRLGTARSLASRSSAPPSSAPRGSTQVL